MKRIFVLIAVSAFFIAHCAGTKQGVVVDETRGDNASSTDAQWDESFDPLTLDDYTLDIKGRNSSSDDVVSVEQLLRGDAIQDTIAVGQEIQGFRVQLISTRDQEEARSIMRNAVISFAENVYREYDNPYYKIRVGDFRSRYDASQLQEKAIEMGFHEAWVVRAIIWDGPPKEAEESKTGDGF